jgi:hypothetical protein
MLTENQKLFFVQTALTAVINEVDRAQSKHPPINSLHEGYAVILEELDEVWTEIKKREPDADAVYKELVQVAAMAIRTIVDRNLIPKSTAKVETVATTEQDDDSWRAGVIYDPNSPSSLQVDGHSFELRTTNPICKIVYFLVGSSLYASHFDIRGAWIESLGAVYSYAEFSNVRYPCPSYIPLSSPSLKEIVCCIRTILEDPTLFFA